MQALIMALRSIGANKLRSVLTMLGIIIGVMALVVLVSLVGGATGSITDSVSDLGSSLLTVTVHDDKGQPVTLADVSQWMQQEDIGLIAPYHSDTKPARYAGNSGNVTLFGVTPAYQQLQGLTLSMGRWLKKTDVDHRSYVCVLSQKAAQELIGFEDCVGRSLILGGAEYTVVGVLQDNEDSLTAAFGAGSLAAYIPYTALTRLSDTVTDKVVSFYVGAAQGSTLEAAESAMEVLLRKRFSEDEDAFSISSQNILEDVMNDITGVLSILLGGIAAISLIVGGIGIMNIMLVTVTERTREIGIRKAIGASRRNILTQFLIEAVVLCMLGCGLGIFLSWGILQAVSAVVASAGVSFTLDGSVVLLAVIFCFVIGVVFGLYPANKAAKMKPIDALHYGG